MSHAYHFATIERAGTSTSVCISERFADRKKILCRYLSEPGIFDFPFDRINPELNTLTEDELIKFCGRVVANHWHGTGHH